MGADRGNLVKPNQVEVPDGMKEYTDSDWSGVDLDLVAASPDGKEMARKIEIVTGSGTLNCDQKAWDGEGLTVSQGDVLLAKFRTINQTSTGVTRVRVSW